MQANIKAPGTGDPQSFNPVERGLGLHAANSSILPDICPPAGLTNSDLRFLVFQVAIERLALLQQQAGQLVEENPNCPRGVSLRVDRLTLQMDQQQAALGQRHGLAEVAA